MCGERLNLVQMDRRERERLGQFVVVIVFFEGGGEEGLILYVMGL